MPAETETTGDFSGWTKTQKLAGLLLMLESDNAARVMKTLEPGELEPVCSEMARLRSIDFQTQRHILAEFSGVAVDASTAVRGGVECVQNLLEKSVGLFRAADIVCRIAPTRAPVGAMQQIAEMDARQIFNLLRHEQPQTIAMVVSYLTPDKSAQVLSLFRMDIREQIVERLATLGPTSIEVVEDVVQVLRAKSGHNRTKAMNQTGGPKAAAQVLNALPKSVSDALLISLRERNPDLGDAVRQKMFSFEELGLLEAKSLQKIMQTVELRTLVVALKTASESLKEVFLSALSRRAAENMREELQLTESLKLREVEAAQLEIVDAAKRLETEGEIDLSDLRPQFKSF